MPDATVLVLVATGIAVGAVSAVSPFLPVEAYVATVALAQPSPVALAAAAGAGVGQTLGKTLVFTSARTAGRSRWLRRLRDRTSREARGSTDGDGTDHPAPAGRPTARDLAAHARRRLRHLSATALRLLGGRAGPCLVLLSAAVGLPPLLLVAFYAGASPMTHRTFVPTCLLGRTARFAVVAVLPGLVQG